MEIFRHVSEGIEGHPRGSCEGCGKHIWSGGGFKAPGIPGVSCSVECLETVLFGQEHCRWCGAEMRKPYIGISSRLCSEDCEESYWKHVEGDKSAALGMGKRFVLWLQVHQPEAYRRLAGGQTANGYCENPNCPSGENGLPASLAHLRAGTRYCSGACKKQARRNSGAKKVLTGAFDPSPTPVLRGFSRDTFAGKASTPYSGNLGLSRDA